MQDMTKTGKIKLDPEEDFFCWVSARCREDAYVLAESAGQRIVLSLDYGDFPERTTWVAVLNAPRETDPNRNHILDVLKKGENVELRLSLKYKSNDEDIATFTSEGLLFTHVKAGRWIMRVHSES